MYKSKMKIHESLKHMSISDSVSLLISIQCKQNIKTRLQLKPHHPHHHPLALLQPQPQPLSIQFAYEKGV